MLRSHRNTHPNRIEWQKMKLLKQKQSYITISYVGLYILCTHLKWFKRWTKRCAFWANVLHAFSYKRVLFICLLCCLFVCVPLLSLSFICSFQFCSVWLFGVPSCGETTLLSSPSEQTMVYIHATKRHSARIYFHYVQHSRARVCVRACVCVHMFGARVCLLLWYASHLYAKVRWYACACIWIANFNLSVRKGQFDKSSERGRKVSVIHQTLLRLSFARVNKRLSTHTYGFEHGLCSLKYT